MEGEWEILASINCYAIKQIRCNHYSFCSPQKQRTNQIESFSNEICWNYGRWKRIIVKWQTRVWVCLRAHTAISFSLYSLSDNICTFTIPMSLLFISNRSFASFHFFGMASFTSPIFLSSFVKFSTPLRSNRALLFGC